MRSGFNVLIIRVSFSAADQGLSRALQLPSNTTSLAGLIAPGSCVLSPETPSPFSQNCTASFSSSRPITTNPPFTPNGLPSYLLFRIISLPPLLPLLPATSRCRLSRKEFIRLPRWFMLIAPSNCAPNCNWPARPCWNADDL